jgi:hypothetical protein
MNWLKKGPELKLPKLRKPSLGGSGETKGSGLKPPAFLADLYYDLRDRRLLPLIALVVVAIAAVPILLGNDVEEPALPPAAGAALESSTAKTSKLTVVEATPGLRDYKKRLKDRSPSDPFEQQYTEPVGGESSSEGASGSTGSSSGESLTVEVEEGGSEVVETTPSTGGSGGGINPETPGLHFFAFRPDIRFGVAGSDDLTFYEELPAGKVLPEKTPVIAFVGVSDDGKRAAFEVSSEVAVVRGDGRCIGGNQSCRLLTLGAGQAVDLVTGRPGREFRLKVESIHFVEVEPPKDAGASAAERGWGVTLAPSVGR